MAYVRYLIEWVYVLPGILKHWRWPQTHLGHGTAEAWHRCHCFQFRWDHWSTQLPITARELLPILLVCTVWGGKWRGQHMAESLYRGNSHLSLRFPVPIPRPIPSQPPWSTSYWTRFPLSSTSSSGILSEWTRSCNQTHL